MKTKILLAGIAGCSLLLMTSCRTKPQDRFTDTITSGVVQISADESFRPIVDQQIDVFEGIYPDASIIPIYTDEVEAINLLLQDSVRFTVATRKLTDEEVAYLNSKKFYPKEEKIATDGIAIIVNRSNPDSLLSVPDLGRILTGEITRWGQLSKGSKLGDIKFVFDNPNSSTVRYAIDSLSGGKPLYSGLFALGNNQAVIDYVTQEPGAMGIIGVSWIGNESDTTRLSFSDRVRVLALSREEKATPGNSYKPYQAYLALNRYPLTRDVYVLHNDPRMGLTSGFTRFIVSDKGQRIILKSGTVPATQALRIVNVREEL